MFNQRRPPMSPPTDTPLPDTTIFRSVGLVIAACLRRTGQRRNRRDHHTGPWLASGDGDGSSGAGAAPPVCFQSMVPGSPATNPGRSEEHTSELQALMSTSYAVFCLKTKQYYISKHKNR